MRPHVALGDFDSAGPGLREWAVRAGARIVRHPIEKDKTDTELALEYALRAGARTIDFYGALGGRLDHELANIALLLRARAAGAAMRLLDGPTTAFLAPRRCPLRAERGATVSLIPVSARVAGVTTAGLYYPLRGETLRRGSTRGISNVVTGRRPLVVHTAGVLLVVITGGTASGVRS